MPMRYVQNIKLTCVEDTYLVYPTLRREGDLASLSVYDATYA